MGDRVRDRDRANGSTNQKKNSDRLKEYMNDWTSGLRQKAWPHLIASARDTYLNDTHVEKYTQANIFVVDDDNVAVALLVFFHSFVLCVFFYFFFIHFSNVFDRLTISYPTYNM